MNKVHSSKDNEIGGERGSATRAEEAAHLSKSESKLTHDIYRAPAIVRRIPTRRNRRRHWQIGKL